MFQNYPTALKGSKVTMQYFKNTCYIFIEFALLKKNFDLQKSLEYYRHIFEGADQWWHGLTHIYILRGTRKFELKRFLLQTFEIVWINVITSDLS